MQAHIVLVDEYSDDSIERYKEMVSGGRLNHSQLLIMPVTPLTEKLGIDEVRELQKKTSYQHKQDTIYYVQRADLLDYIAQNSMLKLLEDQRESVGFALEVINPNALLPTIRSRCLVKSLKKSRAASSQSEGCPLCDKATLGELLRSVSGIDLIEAIALLDKMMGGCRKCVQPGQRGVFVRRCAAVKHILTSSNASAQAQVDNLLIFFWHNCRMK